MRRWAALTVLLERPWLRGRWVKKLLLLLPLRSNAELKAWTGVNSRSPFPFGRPTTEIFRRCGTPRSPYVTNQRKNDTLALKTLLDFSSPQPMPSIEIQRPGPSSGFIISRQWCVCFQISKHLIRETQYMRWLQWPRMSIIPQSGFQTTLILLKKSGRSLARKRGGSQIWSGWRWWGHNRPVSERMIWSSFSWAAVYQSSWENKAIDISCSGRTIFMGWWLVRQRRIWMRVCIRCKTSRYSEWHGSIGF